MTRPYLTTWDAAAIIGHDSNYIRGEIRDGRLKAEVIQREPRPGRQRANPSIRIYRDDFAIYVQRYHPRVNWNAHSAA